MRSLRSFKVLVSQMDAHHAKTEANHEEIKVKLNAHHEQMRASVNAWPAKKQ